MDSLNLNEEFAPMRNRIECPFGIGKGNESILATMNDHNRTFDISNSGLVTHSIHQHSEDLRNSDYTWSCHRPSHNTRIADDIIETRKGG